MTENLQFETNDQGVGIITLAREKALNSLSYDMVTHMLQLLKKWKNEDAIQVILLEGAGERAFCAGGDIKSLYQTRERENGFQEAKQFFNIEYELDLLIATYPKPILVLMDGIVMGGGVGLSYGASHRVVTEKTKWAMPEMNIGFFPDVGACYFLSQTPGYTGRYAALTATTLTGADAIFMGCADYFIPSESFSTLRDQFLSHNWLADNENRNQSVHLFLQAFIQEPPASELAALQQKIDHHFSNKTIDLIIASLEAEKRRVCKRYSAIAPEEITFVIKSNVGSFKTVTVLNT